jgi:hypothetical protein
VLGHVWNRCPPNFTERTFGETRRRGKIRKAEADVRPPVADGEAYRGKETCPAMRPRHHGEVCTPGPLQQIILCRVSKVHSPVYIRH